MKLENVNKKIYKNPCTIAMSNTNTHTHTHTHIYIYIYIYIYTLFTRPLNMEIIANYN